MHPNTDGFLHPMLVVYTCNVGRFIYYSPTYPPYKNNCVLYETDSPFDAMEFPRLTVFHMRKGSEQDYNGVWMLKTRAALVGLMDAPRVVMQLDFETLPVPIPNPGIDLIFRRAREEISADYPYAIMGTHWMSRVPHADAYNVYAVPCNEVPCDNSTNCNPAGSCPNRPMRWGQAGAYTFSHHSEAFMTEVYKNPMKHDDEYDLNIGLWRHHAWKQWCRFIPWSDEKVPTLDPHIVK